MRARVKWCDILDTYTFDNYYEVQVECCVDKQVDDLFRAIPEFIDVDIPFRNL